MKQKANQTLNIVLIVLVLTILVVVVVIFSGKEEVEKSYPQLEFGANMSDEQENKVSKNLELIKSWRKPGIWMDKAENKKFSKLGGLPLLPRDIEWPQWKGKPLSFLAQIDLSEIPENCERNGLPKTGFLFVFYDQMIETWGLEKEDKGGWKIIYSNVLKNELEIRIAPDGLENDGIYKEKYINFKPVMTYPHNEDDRVLELDLDEEIHWNAYSDLRMSVFEEKPEHHFWGYPTPIQGNWNELDSEVHSTGLGYDEFHKLSKEEQEEYEQRSREKWTLLLQIDTDDETGFMWGDCGILYFMIPNDDFEKLNFENVWLVLHCC